jgi:hypothetical protein
MSEGLPFKSKLVEVEKKLPPDLATGGGKFKNLGPKFFSGQFGH